MVIKATISGASVREALAELKEINPKLLTTLRRDIKQSVDGVASGVLNAYPEEGTISGMRHFGRTGYVKPNRAIPSFTPGRARPGKASSLLSIKLRIPDRVGAWIAEMAGSRKVISSSGYSRTYEGSLPGIRKHRLNGQGAYLIDGLNSRTPGFPNGGRYGWAYFLTQKDDLHRKGIEILEVTVSKLNRSSR